MTRPAYYPIVRAFTSIAIGFLVALGPARAEDSSDAPRVVGFEDGGGKTLFLHDYRGHPVLVNLWATWCAPCVEEMPSLAKLQQAYAAKGLVVLTISEDDSIDDARTFFKDKAKDLTGLNLYYDKGHGVRTALQTRGLPTTVLVRRDGSMVQRIEGPVDWQSPKSIGLLQEIMK